MMKNYICILAIAGAALVSCNTEEFTDRDGTPDAIGEPIVIGPSVVDTKVLINNDSDIQAKGISLYGWTFFDTENPELPTFVMNDLTLEHSGSTWDYSPHQYWISNTTHYGFAGIWPHMTSRNDRDFIPTPLETSYSGDEWSHNTTPFDDAFITDDVVRNVICAVLPGNAYLTNVVEEMLGGYVDVPASQYGKPVTMPMEHALCAFRFRVRNLTENPICLHNWYMTGLQTHADMIATIIGGLADGTHTQILHRIEDGRFLNIRHAPVEVTHSRDFILIKTVDADGNVSSQDFEELNDIKEGGVKMSDEEFAAANPHWLGCVDSAPGDNNYKYIVISQKLPEISVDSVARTAEMPGVIAKYQAKYPNYSKQIYWGVDKNMHVNNYYVPLAYERGSVLMDYDNDGVRGDADDYAMNVRVYECRSHMVQCNTSGEPSASGTWYYPNGGIYMPVSATNEANLYSPYFMSSESHTGPIEDWKEGMGVAIDERVPSHANPDGTYSIFRWEANNGRNNYSEGHEQFNNYRWPATNITEAIEHYNAKDEIYPLSVRGGDLANALNDDGYVTMFPQDISKLVFHLWTASKVVSGSTEQDYYHAPDHRTFNVGDFTVDHEWKSGYKYDYLITVTTDRIMITLDVEPWKERHATLQ